MDGHEHTHLLTDPAIIKIFLLAGRATVTLKSLASGHHYTYRVSLAEKRQPTDKNLWFVSVLHSGDKFAYMGLIGDTMVFRQTAKSKFGSDSPNVKAFAFFFGHVVQRQSMPSQLEVRHEGQCGRCGRPLTNPESQDRGIGPVCFAAMRDGIDSEDV